MAIVNILLTYDISSKHSEVKKAMKAKGYTDHIIDGQNKTVYLPNTSLNLKKEGAAAAQAREDLRAVIAAINSSLPVNAQVVLERQFSVRYDDWAAIYGNPHQQ